VVRIGHGFDVHKLVPGRPLILGGVAIPHDKGLLGHSDADVLTHAIMDGLLGALALGNIGDHFPDTDATFKDADSMKLLINVWEMIAARGYTLGNLDAVIAAQKPKLSPFIEAMRTSIAEALSANLDQVSIKATTTETLGFEGREEGISAHAVVLLKPIS
jgi:2-C-methyl-D-erythritol 2,4-cyclodiphosphate synthase